MLGHHPSVYLCGTDAVCGQEGNGTIQFSGTYTSITWTNPTFEDWYGFTVEVPHASVPEPGTIAVFGVGLIGLGLLRRRGTSKSSPSSEVQNCTRCPDPTLSCRRARRDNGVRWQLGDHPLLLQHPRRAWLQLPFHEYSQQRRAARGLWQPRSAGLATDRWQYRSGWAEPATRAGTHGLKGIRPRTRHTARHPYSYFVDAHFSASFGNGTRVEGRPCTIQFARQ